MYPSKPIPTLLQVIRVRFSKSTMRRNPDAIAFRHKAEMRDED